jgi:hypothetical protein
MSTDPDINKLKEEVLDSKKNLEKVESEKKKLEPLLDNLKDEKELTDKVQDKKTSLEGQISNIGVNSLDKKSIEDEFNKALTPHAVEKVNTKITEHQNLYENVKRKLENIEIVDKEEEKSKVKKLIKKQNRWTKLISILGIAGIASSIYLPYMEFNKKNHPYPGDHISSITKFVEDNKIPTEEYSLRAHQELNKIDNTLKEIAKKTGLSNFKPDEKSLDLLINYVNTNREDERNLRASAIRTGELLGISEDEFNEDYNSLEKEVRNNLEDKEKLRVAAIESGKLLGILPDDWEGEYDSLPLLIREKLESRAKERDNFEEENNRLVTKTTTALEILEIDHSQWEYNYELLPILVEQKLNEKYVEKERLEKVYRAIGKFINSDGDRDPRSPEEAIEQLENILENREISSQESLNLTTSLTNIYASFGNMGREIIGKDVNNLQDVKTVFAEINRKNEIQERVYAIANEIYEEDEEVNTPEGVARVIRTLVTENSALQGNIEDISSQSNRERRKNNNLNNQILAAAREYEGQEIEIQEVPRVINDAKDFKEEQERRIGIISRSAGTNFEDLEDIDNHIMKRNASFNQFQNYIIAIANKHSGNNFNYSQATAYLNKTIINPPPPPPGPSLGERLSNWFEKRKDDTIEYWSWKEQSRWAKLNAELGYGLTRTKIKDKPASLQSLIPSNEKLRSYRSQIRRIGVELLPGYPLSFGIFRSYDNGWMRGGDLVSGGNKTNVENLTDSFMGKTSFRVELGHDEHLFFNSFKLFAEFSKAEHRFYESDNSKKTIVKAEGDITTYGIEYKNIHLFRNWLRDIGLVFRLTYEEEKGKFFALNKSGGFDNEGRYSGHGTGVFLGLTWEWPANPYPSENVPTIPSSIKYGLIKTYDGIGNGLDTVGNKIWDGWKWMHNYVNFNGELGAHTSFFKFHLPKNIEKFATNDSVDMHHMGNGSINVRLLPNSTFKLFGGRYFNPLGKFKSEHTTIKAGTYTNYGNGNQKFENSVDLDISPYYGGFELEILRWDNDNDGIEDETFSFVAKGTQGSMRFRDGNNVILRGKVDLFNFGFEYRGVSDMVKNNLCLSPVAGFGYTRFKFNSNQNSQDKEGRGEGFYLNLGLKIDF